MYRRLLLACFLLVLFFVYACGSTRYAHKGPAVRFSSCTLAKHVARQGDLAVPIEPGDRFSTSDPRIIAHVQFENMGREYVVRWDWYSPDGRLYTSSGELPIQTDKRHIRRRVTAWHAIAVQGDKASLLPGKWKVRIYVNNDLVDTRPFVLTAQNNPAAEHVVQ